MFVAEAMVDVFSRIGIPYEMLTDQGSVFMSQLTKELCGLLNIDYLRTTPHHPQTDGCLERWHGSLKHMLRKCEDRKAKWDVLWKYLLIGVHPIPIQTPHHSRSYLVNLLEVPLMSYEKVG